MDFSPQLSELSPSSSSIFSFFTTTEQLSELSQETPEHEDDSDDVDIESRFCSLILSSSNIRAGVAKRSHDVSISECNLFL